MTRKSTDRRREIVRAAARLFRRQGYAGTGLSEILAAADAPRGSLYYYFPDGKEAIGAAAIEAAGAAMARELRRVAEASTDTATLITNSADTLAQALEASAFQDGCYMATTILETAPAVESIRAAGAAAYEAMRRIWIEKLEADGLTPQRAAPIALLIQSSFQGALIMSRAEASTEPLRIVADETARRVRSAVAEVKALDPKTLDRAAE